MNTFNKDIAFSKFDNESSIFQKLQFDEDFNTFIDSNGETRPIFISGKNMGSVLDQFALIGHYIYTKNTEFFDNYKEINNGKPFKIDEPLKLTFFTKNLFNILLYGIVTANYIKNMPLTPKHYLARPIADEKNTSLRDYLFDQKSKGVKNAINIAGGPFYCYMQKKSTFIRNTNTVICPIKHIIPRLKEQAELFSFFANHVYKLLIETKDQEVINFANNFIDQSWSMILKED